MRIGRTQGNTMSAHFTESVVEDATLDWLGAMANGIAHGPENIASERNGDYGKVVLEGRLRDALQSLNPTVPRALSNRRSAS